MQRNLKKAIQQYLKKKASPEQEQQVADFYKQPEELAPHTDSFSEEQRHALEKRMLAGINTRIQSPTKPKIRPLYIRWAAAILLPLISLAIYYTILDNSRVVDLQDIQAGSLHAKLISATGKEYVLSDKEDLLALQQQGIYQSPASSLEDNAWEEIVTPRGGYFNLILADGTSVWLNAETSLRFPKKFSAQKREVYLEGEAYFDVAKNTKAPFYVHTSLQSTKVLGTQFNISSYKEQAVHYVTLIEGSIEASNKNHESIRMTPGHQAKISDKISYQKLSNASDFASWKDGDFYFDDTPMSEVLSMVGRWYDVKVDSDGAPTNKLKGLVSRKMPLANLLSLIETTSNVKFNFKKGVLSVTSN